VPMVVIAGPFVGDEKKSSFAKVELWKNKFEKKFVTTLIFFVNFSSDAAFTKNFKIVKNHAVIADSCIF
jgi:hypothetical protein